MLCKELYDRYIAYDIGNDKNDLTINEEISIYNSIISHYISY